MLLKNFKPKTKSSFKFKPDVITSFDLRKKKFPLFVFFKKKKNN
jgi:hypothetical protein